MVAEDPALRIDVGNFLGLQEEMPGLQSITFALPPGDVAARLKMPPSSLSTNLLLLSNAGLVSSRRDGRSIIYRADYGAMRDLLGFLIEDCCNGSSEICTPLAATLKTCAPGKCR